MHINRGFSVFLFFLIERILRFDFKCSAFFRFIGYLHETFMPQKVGSHSDLFNGVIQGASGVIKKRIQRLHVTQQASDFGSVKVNMSIVRFFLR